VVRGTMGLPPLVELLFEHLLDDTGNLLQFVEQSFCAVFLFQEFKIDHNVSQVT
jgi:hypothetical protein